MFYPKHFGGTLRSWEEFPAAAGTYKIGQLLNMADGQLVSVDAASTTAPQYLCMAKRTVAEGELIPVQRVSYDDIYETTLSADAEGAVIGSKMQISEGGEQVDMGAEGCFEIVQIDDTTAGSKVAGRFLCGGSVAAADQAVNDEEGA